MKKIGILYICTGKYSIFWKDFYLSCEKNFITNSEKHYFVFTDNPEIDFEKENPRIHKIYQNDLGWPYNTLMRFHTFLKVENELTNMDYLFFFNANLLVLKKIASEEFLPVKGENLVATLHPGFFDKERIKFTYDQNPKSTAFISKKQGEHYFAGGLNGGRATDFIEAMKKMRDNIDVDTKNNIIAIWHDESHWNKYLLGRTDIKILPPSYLYPEGWSLPFIPIILVRDKNNYGGYNHLRNIKNNKLRNYFSKIKISTFKFIKNFNINSIFYKFKKPIYYRYNNSKPQNSNLIIITIAFNNANIIKIQHNKLIDNLKEKFIYVVVDNSSEKNISLELYEYCSKNNILYIKLPSNPYFGNPSKSHGLALNWAYENVIKRFKPIYFGFIDHDIIPFNKTSIITFIRNGVWGFLQERNDKWYLWPGFCFYNYNYVKKYRLNFMPCNGLDTGGSNYYSLYKNIDKNNILNIRHSYFDLDKNLEVELFDNSKNMVEIIGNWVHIMRLSNWNNKNDEKNNNLNNIINTIENYGIKK